MTLRLFNPKTRRGHLLGGFNFGVLGLPPVVALLKIGRPFSLTGCIERKESDYGISLGPPAMKTSRSGARQFRKIVVKPGRGIGNVHGPAE